MLFKSLNRLISSGCEKYGKKVSLEHTNYDPSIVPHQYRLLQRDILVQLTRNSVYHGIEDLEGRRASNKNEEGKILIYNSRHGNFYRFVLEDDGQGIRIDKLKKKLEKMDNFDSNYFRDASDDKIAQLIFRPGITTTETANITAGRGIGMDIIKKKLEKIGGSINIAFKAGSFTRFTMHIPIK
jgi:chemotaxis protein histidine kinase CheA